MNKNEELAKEFNTLIMREIGLDVDSENKLIDQDTGLPISFKGKIIIAPGNNPSDKSTIEFDPYNNNRLMGQFYDYYTNKFEDENPEYVLASFRKPYDVKPVPKSSMACRLSDNTVIESKKYIRDSVGYADLILQMNGEDNVNLDKFDIPKQQQGKNTKKNNKNGGK